MLPFCKWGPFDRTERKALLFAAAFSCLFIFVFAFARPHPRRVKISASDLRAPTSTTTYKVREPHVLVADPLERFREIPKNFAFVDFNNRSYGSYRSSDGSKFDLKLVQGVLEQPKKSGWFELKDIFYKDLTGDGNAEAIVWLSHVTCNALCDGGASLFFVYTERLGKLKQIWKYETGTYADGRGLQSLTVDGTELALTLFDPFEKPAMDHSDQPQFISKGLTLRRFKFDGQTFVSYLTEPYDSSPVNTRDYEPEIRIY